MIQIETAERLKRNMRKFCILAAGKGIRNTSISGLHKALLPLENKPVISHIIEKLDSDVDIVIAVGYKSDQIKSYITAVHSDRNVQFVDVDNYDGVGSGPGYSLLCCKDYLQEPFVFTSADTLVGGQLPIMDINEDWLGCSFVEENDSINYCLVSGSKYLDELYYGTGTKAYIGMAGVYNYELFWNALEEHKILKDEYQVIHGFEGINRIKLINFVWHDTGNNESYNEARKYFDNEIVANKDDEAIFIDNNVVVKYFSDEEKVRLRVERTNYLNGTVPKLNHIHANMYSYDYVPGDLLSNIAEEDILLDFLNYCQSNLWNEVYDKELIIDDACDEMYQNKTKERVLYFSESSLDKIEYINGIRVAPIYSMLDEIEWYRFYNRAIPSRFHGDLQPENILYDSSNNNFVLLDWRHSFGSSLAVGDVYYDLGKLYHALLINGTFMLNDMFDYNVCENKAVVQFHIKSNLMYFMDVFEKFCSDNNYLWSNVELIGILQYFNICSLYGDFKGGKYGEFLFLYGKYLLAKFLNREICYE